MSKDVKKKPAGKPAAAASSKKAGAAPQTPRSASAAPSRVDPFSHAGGAEAKRAAKKSFDEKRAAMGDAAAEWPEHCAKDDRWCGWLPEGWTPAVSMTSGGILIKCLVGPAPERKIFYHKVALEAFLGRELETADKPPDYGEFDPKMFLHRTDRTPTVGYIKERIRKLHGMQVDKVIKDFKCTHGEGDAAVGGKKYTVTDLRYDVLSRKFLTLVAKRPVPSAQPLPAPATPAPGCAPRTPRRAPAAAAQAPTPAAAASSGSTAPQTPRGLMPPPAAPSTPRTSGVRPAPSTPSRPAAKRARLHSSSSMPVNQAPSATQAAALDVYRSHYKPLKSKAMVDKADDKTIFTILGAGFSLGLDPLMLKSLPDILHRVPAERGEFGSMTLDQFEKAFEKACVG